MLDSSLTTLGVFYVEREGFIHSSISCWVWQESRHFFCSRYTWWLVIQWVAWKVKWPRSEMGGIWRPTYWGGLQGGGGAREAMVATNKWPEKRMTPTLSKGFHITRSLCSEDNPVPSGKGTALRLPRERMAEVFACPASIPFSSGNASLSSLSVHRAGADITSRLCGNAQPIRMLHSPGHGICPGMNTWPKLGQWEPSWGRFLELLGEWHFFFWGC